MADQTKKRLSGLRRNQQFLYIGIFTLVAVVVWVAGSLFQSQKKTGISAELQKMAIPLNPNINALVIDRLESKVNYSADELGSFEIYRLRIEEQNRARATQAPSESGSFADIIENPEPVSDEASTELPAEEPSSTEPELNPEAELL